MLQPKLDGIIGISGSQLARYAVFYDTLLQVDIPPYVSIVQARGASIAKNRNVIAEKAIELGVRWIWYVDDDQVFERNTLRALLSRIRDPKVDIVSGLYVQRNSPFVPHVYDAPETEEGAVTCQLLKPSDTGLVKRLAVGAGCLLIKTKVFKALEPPYWRLGQIVKDEWCDDIEFFHRVRQQGFEVWCDYDVPVGHTFMGTLWPTREADGAWGTSLIEGIDKIATWPAAVIREEVIA